MSPSKNGLSVAVVVIMFMLNQFGLTADEGTILKWVEAVAIVLAGVGLIWHQVMERPEVKAFFLKK